ncbi:LLM class F420-dependent oxidoreductase [Hoyosella subflava]|uniref:Luciferase family protein n=1 Tax=Hoyosella subflava (strain DSM 45089 / JCM 17490 / NBRC 109087 / DQS3-9A1) TaxID=443218 RepID=F6EEG4_HOYSD|nr:LLM class F420-dependent oxidoreductase [Hoyosella subflava]AEF38616.1 Luciferase family protein [Hoyosella subflava DQS3-9A1]
MKLGVSFPQVELAGSAAALSQFTTAAEDLGYDHVLMYDHVVGAVHRDRTPALPELAYTEHDPFHDPLVSFAYLAALTTRIRLVTGVLVLPQRQTVLVARQVADVSILSGGRLALGVGVGLNYVEYDALGEQFSTRGARLTEQIPYLRRLWTEDVVTFSGKFDQIDRAALNPKPRMQIPIYTGGWSEAAFQRAVALADGFIFAGGNDHSLAAWSRVQQLLQESGRSPSSFASYFNLHIDEHGPDRQRTLDTISRLSDAGATHITASTFGQGFTHVGEHVDYLEWLATHVDQGP